MDRKKREAIEKRLAQIAQLNGGRLTPDRVLKDAKDPKSPLHDQFTWNNEIAGDQWRLTEARELIRSVRVEIKTDSRTVSTVRYVRDPTAGEEQGYVETTKLRTDVDLAREALASELNSVTGLMERASSLAIALDLESQFNDALDRVKQLRTRVNLAA